jgi:hypothetical protein
MLRYNTESGESGNEVNQRNPRGDGNAANHGRQESLGIDRQMNSSCVPFHVLCGVRAGCWRLLEGPKLVRGRGKAAKGERRSRQIKVGDAHRAGVSSSVGRGQRRQWLRCWDRWRYQAQDRRAQDRQAQDTHRLFESHR